jgi:hypothetical protein
MSIKILVTPSGIEPATFGLDLWGSSDSSVGIVTTLRYSQEIFFLLQRTQSSSRTPPIFVLNGYWGCKEAGVWSWLLLPSAKVKNSLSCTVTSSLMIKYVDKFAFTLTLEARIARLPQERQRCVPQWRLWTRGKCTQRTQVQSRNEIRDTGTALYVVKHRTKGSKDFLRTFFCTALISVCTQNG